MQKALSQRAELESVRRIIARFWGNHYWETGNGSDRSKSGKTS